MMITPKGLLQSVEMLTSCMYIHGKDINKEQRKIISAAMAKENTKLDDFLAAFPLEMDTGKAISLFSGVLGKNRIDEEVVLLFFGGPPHINYALGEIRLNGLTGKIADTFLIFHVPLAVTITDTTDSIWGTYKNGKAEISVRNIINLADEFKLFRNIRLKKGQKILVHYGAIVGTNIDPEIWDKITGLQQRNAAFMRACGNIKVINCREFAEITRKIYKSF